MKPVELNEKDALIAVDVQRDFCPGGSLAVPDGDRVIPVLNRWIESAQSTGATIVLSRDWHPPGHVSFEEQGGPWPPHCVQGTAGSDFHPDLEQPPDAQVVSKGQLLDRDQYSVFDGTGLAERLRDKGVERLWVGGLAQDVCVQASVLDGLKEGFEVHVLTRATRPVEEDRGDAVLSEMRSAGAVLEE